MKLHIRQLDSTHTGFSQQLQELISQGGETDPGVEVTVRNIITAVRAEGDSALLRYTRQLDGLDCSQVADLEIGPARLQQAHDSLPDSQRQALLAAATRIREFHERQREQSWRYTDGLGVVLGQQITALDRVGLYVPGGRAAYPSSVLMNALPARVAGVRELIMVVPAGGGQLNDPVLAAAAVAGIDRVFCIGGAQAVAALAYGTQSIPRVDKIVGPGNRYVAAAKRLVFGSVGIDMIAGPSEVVIVSDGSSRAQWVAMDLFAQAEHDEHARAILVCTDAAFIIQVREHLQQHLAGMQRAAIIHASLARGGALLQVRDLDEEAAVVNRLAPEHLELSVRDPESMLTSIRHAGAIFLGHHAAESLGDYCAGPNHVLPTAGSARFSSPLGVYDFQKRSSIIGCDAQAAAALAAIAVPLAEAEGLQAHALSAQLRRPSQGRH